MANILKITTKVDIVVITTKATKIVKIKVARTTTVIATNNTVNLALYL